MSEYIGNFDSQRKTKKNKIAQHTSAHINKRIVGKDCFLSCGYVLSKKKLNLGSSFW